MGSTCSLHIHPCAEPANSLRSLPHPLIFPAAPAIMRFLLFYKLVSMVTQFNPSNPFSKRRAQGAWRTIGKKSWRPEGDSAESEERETTPVYKWESCPGSRLSRPGQIARFAWDPSSLLHILVFLSLSRLLRKIVLWKYIRFLDNYTLFLGSLLCLDIFLILRWIRCSFMCNCYTCRRLHVHSKHAHSLHFLFG